MRPPPSEFSSSWSSCSGARWEPWCRSSSRLSARTRDSRSSPPSWPWPTPRPIGSTKLGSVLDRLAGSDFRLPLDVAWLTATIASAEAAAACGDPRYAQPLLEQLAPFADQWLCTDVSASGPVSRTVGDLLTNLGRYGEAEKQFAAAQASSRKADALFFMAQTDQAWGRMLTQRDAPGDRDRAHDLLIRAPRCRGSAATAPSSDERRLRSTASAPEPPARGSAQDEVGHGAQRRYVAIDQQRGGP